MDKVVKHISLKEQLDEIDGQVVNEVFDSFYESRLRILIGIWEKGETIAEYREVNSASFYKLEKETGRQRESLKRWHDLYKQYPEKEKYIEEEAKPKAKIWTERVFEKERKRLSKPIESPPLPEGKYFVIYADPPWQFQNIGFDESAEQQYPTMPIEEICALPVKDLIDEKAVLFLWTTNAFIEEAVQVCRAWGFEYKTNFAWIKNKGPSIGWFTKSRHELLLIATRGEGVHPKEKLISWFQAEATKHSKKPELVYGMIEKMYSGPYIELFARQTRKGWDGWGNELQ